MLVVGEVIGHAYRIVRLIGQGGMGEVYEAIHETLSRRVAIKTIRPDLVNDEELVTRFRREAEAAAALGHPNIVQVTDFVMEAGKPPVMVMELLEGRTLRELVVSAQKLETARAVFIALQVLAGLAAAHKAGIIHRDVKPANVFLQKTLAVRDHVKLLDFGLAKLSEGKLLEVEDRRRLTGPLTGRGMVVGTRSYMAPEQEAGEPVDARADLYSLGATLYYALSGVKHRETSADPSSPLPLSKVDPEVPAKLGAVVDRALAQRPADRFASAEEMAEALSVFSTTTPGFGKATLLPGRRLEATAGPVRPPMDSSTETGAPMTERDARFDKDVIDSAGTIRSGKALSKNLPNAPVTAPLVTDPLEITVDDNEARRVLAGEESVDPTADTHQDLARHTHRLPPLEAGRTGTAKIAAQHTAAMTPPAAPPQVVAGPISSPIVSTTSTTSTTVVRPRPGALGAGVKLAMLITVFVLLLIATLVIGRYLH